MTKNCATCRMHYYGKGVETVVHHYSVRVLNGKAKLLDDEHRVKYHPLMCLVSHSKTKDDLSCSFYKAPK